MIAKKGKNRNKKKFSFNFFSILLGFLLLIIGFLVFSNINIALRRIELIQKIETIRKEIQFLETENQKLEDGIARVDDKDFLEKKAREELGLKRPGEGVIIISPTQEELEKQVEKEKGFWQRALERLGF